MLIAHMAHIESGCEYIFLNIYTIYHLEYVIQILYKCMLRPIKIEDEKD